ncbi:hypothetical protein [Pseudomonas protegens]|uniref:hypothetical protein n=1 Tax=Pseudomonas protegens TaxID=380021 RepID=UPI0015E0B29D|nr:hypothetical protein [Pseudomonas protegens]
MEGADTRSRMERSIRPSTVLVCSGMSSVGNSVRAIVDMSRFINHVLSRNNFYRWAQQSLTIVAKDRNHNDFHYQQKPQKGLEKAPPPDLYPPLKAAFHMASPLVKRGL